MADWTDADQRQLDQLQKQYEDLQAEAQGNPVADRHVAAVSKPITPEDQASSGFSPVRMLVGAGRDIIEEPLKFAEAAGDKLEQIVPLPIVRFGKYADNGIADIVTGDAAKKFARDVNQMPHLGDLEGSANASAWEKLGRNLVSFAVPFAGWSRTLGVAKAGVGITGRIARGAAAGFATDFVNQDPAVSNMATAVKDVFGLDDPALNWLSYNPDDPELTSRLKAAATNIPVGILADGVFALGGKALQVYGRWRGEAEEAKGIVQAMEHDYGIKPVERPAASALADAEAGGVKPVQAEEPFNPSVHVGFDASNQPKSWEDILSYLERKVDDPNLKPEELDQLAKIAQGDPENALARLGIEPTKLDWQEFTNPDGIERLHQSLINIYEKVGQRLGRTGETVSEAALHTAARSFASDAEVLKVLFGSTKNLPEILMGARMFVGGHAHKLLSDATDALQALREGGGTQEWQQFLESFHRHALYLGTVRGAGSEIARALRSLQFLARHDLKGAKGMAADVAKAIPAGAKQDAAEVADNQLNSMLQIKDDSEKIMVLAKILEKQGDTGELAQFVRGEAGNFLKRADGVVRETTSNLFSSGTAAYNVKASLSMLTLRGLGRWMAAAGRAIPALFSAEQARLYRVAAADAWAYTDGIVSSLNEAMRNTFTELEREASADLYINADNLGLKALAKKAALANAEAGAKLTGKHFERVDINATPRMFSFNPADRRALAELIDSENMPSLVLRGLNFITRAVGATVNATGSLTRLGTILFINAPDQFMGTVAAQAGKQSAAVRLAATRAAELGIEGPALSKYLKARVASLNTDLAGWSDNGFEDGYRALINKVGENEYKSILFQDAIESKSIRRLSQAIANARFGSFFVPFPHTPVRILERTLVDYTPLGLLKDRMRQAIFHGTPQQREQALTQLGLGSFLMYQAYRMAEDRDIVGSDGGFTSTARLNRESFTMRIGADVYEFVRDDPLGTLLGLGADLKAAMDHYDPNNPEHKDRITALSEASAWSVAVNVLSKTWMMSLKNITDLAGAYTDGQFAKGLEHYLKQSIARRIVPGAGIQKTIESAFDPWERQALTFNQEMLKYTIGAEKLPQKRNWLGEPEEKNLGERFIGLTWKPEKTDPLIRELDRLSIPAPLPSHDISGVDLTAAQYSRLLELRGVGVKGPTGETLKDTLNALIRHPAYAGLTDPTKADQIKQYAEGYTKLAKDALLQEDPELHARVLRQMAYDQGRVQNMKPDQLQRQNEQLGRELGLTQ